LAYPKSAWILTDGKAGDELQCLGVAEALNLKPEIRRIAPRHPYDWLAPCGPVDPSEKPDQPDSPLRGPFPDLVIGSGRRAIPALRFLKELKGDQIFTVCLKDPRTGPTAADLIWVPEHDRLTGPNVIRTLTSPHRLRLMDLQAARIEPPRALLSLPHPRVGVLVGGNSRNHLFTDADIQSFVEKLESITRQGAALIVTMSRRTPKALADAVQGCVAASGGYVWDGSGANPYRAILALSDQFVVTADSVNMISEACITGRPILVFEPSRRLFGNAAKINRFISGLIAYGAVQNFQGTLESYAYKPLDSTPVIADAIKLAFANR
jgi:mitochondrial fission protein ELM1